MTAPAFAQTVQASLERYEPELLGTYRHGSIWCSSLLEYLALLANGDAARMPLPAGPLNEALITTRLLFGSEAIEYRAAAATRVGAMLGIKEYASPSVVGLYNRLLSAPFPLVLTQSFAFISRGAAQALLQRQINRMANAGDLARSQAAQLHAALDPLSQVAISSWGIITSRCRCWRRWMPRRATDTRRAQAATPEGPRTIAWPWRAAILRTPA